MYPTLRAQVPILDLAHFDIRHDTGFLPKKPLQKLPKKFAALDELAHNLPRLVESGTDNLRRTIDDFPFLNVHNLNGSALRRAMMIYHFAQSAYVKSPPETRRIPANLAIPSWILAKKYDKPSILSYNSYILDNWKLRDPNGPFEIENLSTLIDFVTIPDDAGFKLVHVAVDYRAASGLSAIGPMQRAVLEDDALTVEACLWRIAGALFAMCAELIKMPLWCNPDIYYLRVRPWIQMFSDIIYDGVEIFHGQGQTFRAETGAQNSAIPSLAAALGVTHTQTPITQHLDDMLLYMPPPHRDFIRQVTEGPSSREYVFKKRRSHPALIEANNAAIDGLVLFRERHFEYPMKYLVAKKEGPLGTGGTPYEQWLRKLINETKEHYIPKSW